MNRYLQNLILRHTPDIPHVQPRLRGKFESTDAQLPTAGIPSPEGMPSPGGMFRDTRGRHSENRHIQIPAIDPGEQGGHRPTQPVTPPSSAPAFRDQTPEQAEGLYGGNREHGVYGAHEAHGAHGVSGAYGAHEAHGTQGTYGPEGPYGKGGQVGGGASADIDTSPRAKDAPFDASGHVRPALAETVLPSRRLNEGGIQGGFRQTPAAEPIPAIQVTIGRIEVRATVPPMPAASASGGAGQRHNVPPKPRMTLDNFLKRAKDSAL
jgi:hypothetical protein